MIFWGRLVFSRENRRLKRAKFNIYLVFEDCRGFRCGSLFGAVVVSTGGRWCRAQGLPVVFCGVFRPFAAFAFLQYLRNMPLFGVLRAFLWGFSCSVWVCLAWVLCVDCGAFYVRVRLGGFVACCVFCLFFCQIVPQNLSFCPFVFLSCPAFVLLSRFASWLASLLGFCSWSLGLLVLWLLAFFPFRTASDIKRRGANCAPSCGRVLLY